MYNIKIAISIGVCLILDNFTHTHTHTTVLLLVWNMSAGTRKVKPRRLKPIWIYWSKRQ